MTPAQQEAKYGKVEVCSSQYGSLQPKPGWSTWIENGIWCTAPTVSGKEFCGHTYDNGGFEKGIRDCPCGCHMGPSSSWGPCDPHGPCPENPRPKPQAQAPTTRPWGPADVPPVCWLRPTRDHDSTELVCATCYHSVGTMSDWLSFICLQENYEYSTDLKTWKKCEVEV